VISQSDYKNYVRRIGPPRVVRCDIDLGAGAAMFGNLPPSRKYGSVWVCRSHELAFDERDAALDTTYSDRCPVSRLEEYRARRWAAAG
jgi:hypothetical protein